MVEEYRDCQELVRRAKQGDENAISLLYHRHLSAVYRFIYARTGTRADAEDLTSETFFRMLKNLNAYQGKGDFRNWLLGIARHIVLDFWHRRYRFRQTSLEAFGESLSSEPEGILCSNPQKQLVIKRILDSLPDNYWQVLKLRFLEGKTIKETSQAMGCTESNVKVRQYRALKKATQLVNAMPEIKQELLLETDDE